MFYKPNKTIKIKNKHQTRNVWQSPACSPRGIAVTPCNVAQVKQHKVSSGRPRKLITDPRTIKQ